MAGLGRPLSAWVCAALCWGLCVISPAPLRAQFRAQFPTATPLTPEEILRQRLPHEPQVLSELEEAQALLSNGDHDGAMDILQPLLEQEEDFFDLPVGQPSGSLLNRAELMLRALPPEAVESYRRRYESLAAQRLAQARKSGDLAELLAISRIYPLTLAAAEAIELAGESAFDQGETALAARLWERLLPTTPTGPERTTRLILIARAWTLAGQPDQAVEFVRELSPLAQTSPIEFEGKLLTPPETRDAAWLNKVFGPVVPLVPHRVEDWRMGGGHPRRWGDGPLVSPLQRGRWAYPLIDTYDVYDAGHDEKFLSILKSLESKYLRTDGGGLGKTTPLVIGSPLVDGDTVLVQGIGSVKALDARTGTIRWSGVVEDDTFLYWTRRNYVEPGSNASHDRLVEMYLSQRAWQNQAGSSLASDGQHVYAISGTRMTGAAPNQNMFMRNRGQPGRSELTPTSDNRLLAYDLQTGLLKWESGGPSVATPLDEDGQSTSESRRLGGAFFLGAPLAVDGQIFSLAEHQGQIRLFSISPETGEAVWSLPVLNPAVPINYDLPRRMFGLSPSYAGGLLICPTADGVVVAIDPLRRRVEWFQQYQSRSLTTDPRVARMLQIRINGGRMSNEASLDSAVQERRWFDANPVLTTGRILLPTPDNNMLYCLEMETGKTLWERPRGEGLFIAACTERLCLIAGDKSLQAINLSDGKVRWSQEIPTPTGRGVVSGGQYLLPVSTHEIFSIQMKTGRILARSSIDPAHTAGSLVAAGDQLLMQTTTEMIGLRSLSEMSAEIARTRDDASTRASALAEQGELLLFQGREPEAVALLQESLQLQESPPTRRLLVWSLLERLKADFAGSKGIVADLKKTVTDPDQRRLLNRLNAEGLEKSGETLAAFREYLDLIPEVGQSNDLMELSFDHRVRDDRWLRGRLAHLQSLASVDLRQQMQLSLNQVIAAQAPSVKPHYASVLGIDLAPQLHLELALKNGLDRFKTERILWTLSESRDLSLRGPAVAQLIRHELTQKRTTFIGHLVSELQLGLASVECEPGVTGSALLESLRRDALFSPLLQTLDRPATAPTLTAKNAGTSVMQRELFPVLGQRRGPYADWLFSAEYNPTRTAQCADGSGRVRHTLNLDSLGEVMQPNQLRYVQTDAQLVLLAFRDRFAVISPMDAGGNQFQTRFKATFAPNANGDTPNAFIRGQGKPVGKPAVRDTIYPNSDGTYLGNVGPLTYDTLCYLSGSDLVAVQPQTLDSHVQWRRSGVTPGSEICADSEYVILIPPLLDRLFVLRAADGVQIAERALPQGRVERQRADWGRLFLVTRTEPGSGTAPASQTWAMYDPVTDKDAWSVTLAAGTLWAPVEGADLAFLEPDGTFHLLDDQTGKPLWKAVLPTPTTTPKEFTVHTDQDRLYVHTWRPATPDQDRITETSLPPGRAVRVNGLVVALDRQDGKIQWSRSLEQQLFRPHLPVGSGMLAYAVQRRKEILDMPAKSYTQLEFLNRNTGEPAYAAEVARSGGTGEGWVRLPSGVMLLRVSGQDFRLTWEGETAPEEAAPAQEEPAPAKPIDAPIKPL